MVCIKSGPNHGAKTVKLTSDSLNNLIHGHFGTGKACSTAAPIRAHLRPRAVTKKVRNLGLLDADHEGQWLCG
ncbi:unnamed protein product [Ilex paraguariensis]|uniref:Uncharacterized protein n=1 Tax=Ilex paraguariensis TaxID=185542 RepID=A0ABC8RSS8_9AQUA